MSIPAKEQLARQNKKTLIYSGFYENSVWDW